jgi:dienelactone hydrolase
VPDAARPVQTHVVPSADGKSLLTAYLWRPKQSGPWPAVVLLHGRQGVYAKDADRFYGVRTISGRHRAWGELWAKAGHLALLVDSSGARGYPGGFAAGSYNQRPPEVGEKTARPLDAYGALYWLRGRSDVAPDRIGLHGWSNGGMAALWAMSTFRLLDRGMNAGNGFRAALAFYPGCGRPAKEEPGYLPYAPVRMFLAGQDEEVDPETCSGFAKDVKARGGAMEALLFPNAHHNFDDPSVDDEDDRAAAAEARSSAHAFFAQHLGG